jgi:phthalate 4,5-dioxygenase reductase component
LPTPTQIDASTSDESFIEASVAAKREIATGTFLFELVVPAGDGMPVLPPFTAGSHLTVVTPSGVRRNYSLCGDPADTARYCIAVKRDANGRGGSVSMADDVAQGSTLLISAPRNKFELAPRAKKFLFIAGGIGITPILSMMRHLKNGDLAESFSLIYCTRNAENTAFAAELAAEFSGKVTLHHDHGDANQVFDFWPVLERPGGAHIYCCGPKALMDAVADMSGHWPSGSVHFESFGVDATAFAQNAAFDVLLQKSGRTLHVEAEQTLLEALRANGCTVRSSCESGTCGSCRTALISGDVEHRDMVLLDDERESEIMVCVSRARSCLLVLDL